MIVGDTPSRVVEAAKHAKKLIGCKIMDSTPYYRADGHLQVILLNNHCADQIANLQLLGCQSFRLVYLQHTIFWVSTFTTRLKVG